jgi:hypothetical protein
MVNREAYISEDSVAEACDTAVKNEWRPTSTPPIHNHGTVLG